MNSCELRLRMYIIIQQSKNKVTVDELSKFDGQFTLMLSRPKAVVLRGK
jgi:hypothetical protein